jgi:hypothetical protein
MDNFLHPDQMNRVDRINGVRQRLLNFGFYHDLHDVKRMYAEYVNNKHYGYAGGVMDQPDTYWHDMSIMKDLEFYVEELLPFASAEEKEDKIREMLRGEGF